MAVQSKEDLGRLYEIVGSLDREDLAVLKELKIDEPTSPLRIAAKSYVLPRVVRSSIRRLVEAGLAQLEETKPSDRVPDEDTTVVKLTPDGQEAKSLASLFAQKLDRA